MGSGREAYNNKIIIDNNTITIMSRIIKYLKGVGGMFNILIYITQSFWLVIKAKEVKFMLRHQQ